MEAKREVVCRTTIERLGKKFENMVDKLSQQKPDAIRLKSV